MRKTKIISAIAASCLLTAGPVSAADLSKVKIDGFLSTRYSVTDVPDFYLEHREDGGINQDGSFYGTKLGLNISTRVNEDLGIKTQLISQSETSGYVTHLDWAFAELRTSDSTTLRVGKIKFPVGLVNEYVDVGAAYPWIQAPVVIYSELPSGPQATRESYTGASLLWSSMGDTWSFDTDLFAGQVNLTGMTIKGMVGLTARAHWNDIVDLQASSYTGEMKPDDPTTMMGMAMDGKEHSATTFGVKADWNNIIAYAESASVTMDAMNGAMDSDSWYATLGYRLGKWLPHVTKQNWDQDSGYGQEVDSVGLNYSLSPKTVIKLEVSNIKSDKLTANPMLDGAAGLFSNEGSDLTDDSVQMWSIALDTVF